MSGGTDRDMDRDTGGMGVGTDRDMDRGTGGMGVGTDRDMDRGTGGMGAGTDRDMDRGTGGMGAGTSGAGDRGMSGGISGGTDGGMSGGTEGRPGSDVALLDASDADGFRQRWGDAQTRFVDDPREAVRTADALVAELMQSLAQGFDQHRQQLETQWNSGGEADTESLRQALQRYRSFFDRLLST
jgi:hypothetical protein